MPRPQNFGAMLGATMLLAIAGPGFAGDSTKVPREDKHRYGRTVEDAAVESRILFTENGGLFTMQADGSDIQRVLPRNTTCKNASWSPDGREIVLVGEMDLSHDLRGPGIYVVHADGSDLRKIADTRGFPTRPTWSPVPTLGGEHVIVFSDAVNDNETQYDLFSVRLDGSDRRNLTQSEDVKETHPVWSPDAQRIAFVATYSRAEAPRQAAFRNSKRSPEPTPRCVQDVMVSRLVRDASGLLLVEPENVTDVRGSGLEFQRDSRDRETHRFEGLAWAHGAPHIAVLVRLAPKRDQSDIWVIDLSNPGAPRNVTSTRLLSEESVSWSPDDSHLLFARTDSGDGPAGIFAMRAVRRGKAKLLQLTSSRRPEDWQRVTPERLPDVFARPILEDLGEESPR